MTFLVTIFEVVLPRGATFVEVALKTYDDNEFSISMHTYSVF